MLAAVCDVIKQLVFHNAASKAAQLLGYRHSLTWPCPRHAVCREEFWVLDVR